MAAATTWLVGISLLAQAGGGAAGIHLAFTFVTIDYRHVKTFFSWF
jgi:hypothetical protein